MRSPRHALALAALLAAATTLPAQKPAYTPATTVAIESGTLHGSEAGGILSFKGIPYAAPPVGNLRWRDPQPVAPWNVPREADNFGKDCIQARGKEAVMADGNDSEDCLFLSVWRSSKPSAKLPVMVWIHGGGFVSGGSSARVFDGAEYAKRGVVLVSLNYRLGRFGFFAHPALTAEAPQDVLGNYGLMDQIAALKWVQRNIAAFGGDPGTVTIFGESAGGFSVQALLTSPLAKGLFTRAIVESGAGRVNKDRLLAVTGLANAEQVGVAFAKTAGVEGTDKQALAKLRALPPETLRGDLNMMHARTETDTYSGPIVDGKLSVGVPANIYQQGGGANVPLMIGATDMDMSEPEGRTREAALAAFGPAEPQARTAYDPSGTAELREMIRAMGSDRQMVEPARYAAKIYAARGLPVYEYRFSYVPVALRPTTPGAKHASELGFVFDNPRMGKSSPEDGKMAEAMIDYWSAFGRTGDPNQPGLPVWPRYSAKTDLLMDFSNDGPKPGPDPWRSRLDAAEAAALATPPKP